MIIDIESDENDLFLNAKLLTQDDKFLGLYCTKLFLKVSSAI